MLWSLLFPSTNFGLCSSLSSSFTCKVRITWDFLLFLEVDCIAVNFPLPWFCYIPYILESLSPFSFVSRYFLIPLHGQNASFHPFTLSLCVSLHLKWASCQQPVDGFCILSIQPPCLLIGAFSPFIFKVSVDRYMLIAILLSLGVFRVFSLFLLFLLSLFVAWKLYWYSYTPFSLSSVYLL